MGAGRAKCSLALKGRAKRGQSIIACPLGAFFLVSFLALVSHGEPVDEGGTSLLVSATTPRQTCVQVVVKNSANSPRRTSTHVHRSFEKEAVLTFQFFFEELERAVGVEFVLSENLENARLGDFLRACKKISFEHTEISV